MAETLTSPNVGTPDSLNQPGDARSTTFLWFFGPSAAGKETAIASILGDPDHPLRQLLALSGAVVSCDASRDTSLARGEALLDAILGDAQVGLNLVIKGQVPDLEAKPPLPWMLRERARWDIHRVAFFWATPVELHRRCIARGWANSADDHRKELAGQGDRVTGLNLPTTWIRSSSGEYEITDPP